ncbi:MAG: pantetheine-phosphate adenylyltransferase [Elusimicrobia bacterium RIFCSPLOWO2_01_FULL_59_12]|nr:MAG: pantetheine-phosphate adenylyltransferase [Elusimicrobia bacterium RIFCSPLOWO2_01_FULL_59_12]
MKRAAIYPGSFDPVTNGHLDIIERARHLFDEIIVAVSENPSKRPYFSLPERLRFLHQAVGARPGVRVEAFSGLLTDYVKKKKAVAVIRGLRAVSDFEYEFQMALMNRRQNNRFETVFLMPDEKYTYLSSSLVREVSRLGGRVRGLVPTGVEKALQQRAQDHA